LFEEIPVVRRGRGRRTVDVGLCKHPTMFPMLYAVVGKISEALNVGVKVIVDKEPVLYESVLSLVSVLTGCAEYHKADLLLEANGRPVPVYMSLFRPVERDGEITVMFDVEPKEQGQQQTFEAKLREVYIRPNILMFLITQGNPQVNLTTAIFESNFFNRTVKRVLVALDKQYGKETDEYRRKIPYVGRVPYTKLIFAPADVVERVARTWAPPPPAYSDTLRKKPRRLDQLVIPEFVKDVITRYLEVIKSEGTGSILAVGLQGSGRKTLAATIAAETGLPAYHLSIANIKSKWVGESEARLSAFFESLRARGGVAVIEGVETLYKGGTSDSVTPSLRTVLINEMSKDDNNFIVVFTSSERTGGELLTTPVLGEIKLVLPVPDTEERRTLVRMFARELAGEKWGALIEVAMRRFGKSKEDAEEALLGLYADTFVEPTIGMTPGEIYRVMRIILVPTYNYVLSTKRIQSITRYVHEYTKRDFASRQATLHKLAKHATSLGWLPIAEQIKRIIEEMTRLAVQTREKPQIE